ncbi:hypothetical protein ACTJLD_30275 [Burkholderia sp. 22088]|uniref:hypothetical protein n=1 Tax=Burkholderia sp. 22088 TaxID=3453871 RepID=UPI003F835EEC
MTTQITISTPKANRKELAESFGQNQSAVRRLEAMTQDITINLPDAIDSTSTIAQQALALAQALQQVAYVVAAANAEVPNADVLQAGTGLSLVIGSGTITLSLTVPVTVAHGGTGLTSLTQHGVVVGNGASAPNFAVPGSSGQVLTSNGPGADPSFQTLPTTVTQILAGTGINVSSATGNVTVSLQTPVAVANGGTGSSAAGGTALDNISGFTGTGLLQRTGAGAYSFVAPSTYLQASNNLSDLASASTARTNLGLGTAAVQNVSFFLQAANNLSDLASASTARTNLGLGTAATQNTGTSGATVPLLNGTNTWSGTQTLPGTTNINGAAATNRALFLQTAGVNRWDIKEDSTAESGSNAGSNFAIDSYNDAGVYLATPFKINRATGVTTISSLTVGSSTLVASSVALTNGAGSASATLTNAPTTGNPTKWVPVNDNGTTRYIPMW